MAGTKETQKSQRYNQYKNEITLPLHTNMTDEQVDYVIKNFVEIINM